VLVLLAALGGGCSAITGTIGAIAATEQREGSHTVDAEYRGLANKSFAVFVTAPASLQADRPGLTPKTAITVSETLEKFGGASGFVPGSRVVSYQNDRPNWVARPMGEVAKDLGVQRIVVIDIHDYRLRDPGNQYTWEGVATALIGVYECDSSMPDDLAFQKIVQVRFPDETGRTPAELPEAVVNTELTRRLCERAAWLFYTHDEKNALKY
jgi:hypothetical protein